MNKILKFILDIIFPIKCVNCKKEGEWVCLKCKDKFLSNFSVIKKNNIDNLTFVDDIFYFFNFTNEIIPKLIHIIKYKYAFDVARFLAQLIVVEFNNFIKNYENIIFVPIPLNKKRYNERGFNQSEIILKNINLLEDEKIMIVNILKRVKNTEHQARLSGEERNKNLRDAFEINKEEFEKYKNFNIVLFDDVVTTGNTFDECAKVLKENHFRNKIFCLAIAGQN